LIVGDTSFLFALLARPDAHHEEAVDWFTSASDEVVTTPFVLAELDYLVTAHGTRTAIGEFRRDITEGAYVVEWWPDAAPGSARIAERYGDLGVSLTEASLIALAARLSTTRIAAFDERHFRAVRPLRGGAAFTLVPADA
jgi:predicted nucleic acid-binding protein